MFKFFQILKLKVFSNLIVVLFCAMLPVSLYSVAANISVDYSNNINSFNYRYVYGSNSVLWQNPANFNAVRGKLQASGTYLVRGLGGAMGDSYHWNGNGSYSAQGVWQSDNTTWSKGFTSKLLYDDENVFDGDQSSAGQWRSVTETAQAYMWVRMNTAVSIDHVTIYWDAPYAVDYQIQYWSVGSLNWAPHESNIDQWVTVANVTGATGGIDNRVFTPASAQTWRVLMTQSSGQGYRINEIELFAGVSKQVITSSVGSPTHRANQLDANFWQGDFETYMTFVQSLGPQATPLLVVNFGDGSPEEAAAWVHYANGVQGYNIQHWEIGNESAGAWEQAGPVDAVYYANRYIEFAQAMRAEDPSIKLYGTANSLDNASQLYDGVTYAEKFLQILNAQGKMNLLDGLSHHEYPTWPNTNVALSLSTPSKWAGWKSFVEGLFSTYAGGPKAKELIMTEYNSGPAAQEMTMSAANALWFVNWMGEFLSAFGSNGKAMMWDIINGSILAGDGEHGMFDAGNLPSPYTYQERPDYWGLYMMNQYFSVEDETGNTLVATVSDQILLPAYSCKRSDGKLSLIVVNKSPMDTYNTNINVSNFNVNPNAQIWTWGDTTAAPYYTDSWNWINSVTPPYADVDLPPKNSNINFAGNSFSFNFPAYSITVFQFDPLTTPTPTVTQSSTATLLTTSTYTQTVTTMVSPSVTLTATFSSSPTALLSPSNTSTAVPTSTISPTVSVSPSRTVSPTGTISPTETPMFSPTYSATMSQTPSVSPSLTASPIQTAFNSQTASPTQTALNSQTVSPSATVTATALASTVTLTPNFSTQGPLNILSVLVAPNPILTAGAMVMINLSASAEEVRIKIYTPGMTLVTQLSAGPFPGAWARVPLGDAVYNKLNSGLYYLRVEAIRSGVDSVFETAKMMILK